MLGRINYGCLILVVTGAILLPAVRPAHAQSPAVVCVLSRGTDGRLCPGSPWAVWPAHRVSSRGGLPVCSHDDLLRTSRRNHDVLPVGECHELLPVGARVLLLTRDHDVLPVGECHELLPIGARVLLPTRDHDVLRAGECHELLPVGARVLLPTRDHDVLRAGECHERLRSGSTVLHGPSAGLRAVRPASHDPVHRDWAVMPGHAGLATNGIESD